MHNNLLITVDGIELYGPCLLEDPEIDLGEDPPEDGDENTENEDDNQDDDNSDNNDDDDNKDEGKNKDDIDDSLSRFTLEDLKEAFKGKPELLKEARHAFFREQQFTSIFPTVEEAQKAADAQIAYQEISEAVVDGDVSKFLSELKNETPEGLNKFVTNFIPALLEANKELYFEVAEPIVKQYLKRAYDHGKTLTDEKQRNNVTAAAKLLRTLLFGGRYEDIEAQDAEGITNKDKKKDNKDDDEKNKYFARQGQELYKIVTELCYSKLDEEINKGLDDLTKTKPGLKKLIAKEIRRQVFDEMEKDRNYTARMNSLWAREKRNGFSGTLKPSFLTTFLGKAKVLIPKIRIEARKEALGKEDLQNNTREPNRITGGRESRNNGSKRMTPERAKAEGLTTRQIFDA